MTQTMPVNLSCWMLLIMYSTKKVNINNYFHSPYKDFVTICQPLSDMLSFNKKPRINYTFISLMYTCFVHFITLL